MYKYLLIVVFMMANIARADTFVVTTPLDNTNPGTLRWALQEAYNNGNQPNWDTITFNIPSAAPGARAIQILSELPVISSYLVIDGTTQLFGTTFGVSDAKIAIIPKVFANSKRGFVMRNVDHVEIYGLLFAGFINSNPIITETWSDGIFMWNVHDVIIGAPSRGNAFFGCYHALRHEALDEVIGRAPPPGIGHHITVQSNYFGKNNTGTIQQREGVVNAVELLDVNNVAIGGYGLKEDNKFMVFLSAVKITLKTNLPADNSNISVVKNNFIIGTSNPPLPVALPVSGIQINDVLANPGIHYVNISGNDMLTYVTGISIGALKHPFKIVNNIINCDRLNNNAGFSNAIAVVACDSGLIGGRDSANIIHDTKNFGITMSGTKYITISKNSIYCNPKGIAITAPATIIPKITDMYIDAAGNAFGKTCADCRVEVFDTHSCIGEFYNGETYLTTIIASPTGDFIYAGPNSCFNTSFTVTNLINTTSQFYVPYNFILDSTGVIKVNASCGQTNGSIKGIKIFSGVDFYWEDINGNVVGTDTNLINVGAGFYRLVGTKQNIGCQLWAGYYQITDVVPLINTNNLLLTDPVPQCNRLGSITGITVSGGPAGTFSYKWTNHLGVIVGTTLSINNLPAGSYRLTVSVVNDPNCNVSAGPFTLTNQLAPQFDLTNVRVTNASCGLTNGGISGIVIINANGAQSFKWKDAAGNIVGTTASLSNVGAGAYQLEYDDASPCPPMTTAFFTIVNNGLIIIDESNKLIIPSGCTIIKGAIRNITVSGANVLQWVNTASGAVVGNAPDLINIPSGNYRLRVFDTNFGCADSTGIIFVPTTVVESLAVQSKNVKDEFCSAANGYIQNIVLSPSPVGYTYKWVKNTTDTFAFTLNVSGLAKGNYQLIGTDSNGCTQVILQQTITDHPSPILDETNVVIKDDECTQSIGSIKGMSSSSGDAPFNYTWYAAPSGSFVINSIDIPKTGAGNFYIIVTDKNGCKDTGSILVVKDISPIITPPQYDPAYAKRNSFSFVRNLNGIAGSYEIFDAPSSNTPIETNTTGTFKTINLTADKDYWVRRVVGSCYSIKVKVHVTVIDFSKVFVPNAFTPDNNGLNDVLKITVYGKIIIDGFYIYNRWGQQVFFTSDVNKGWDGNNNGKPLSKATYAWMIKGYDIDGTPISLQGTVILIR